MKILVVDNKNELVNHKASIISALKEYELTPDICEFSDDKEATIFLKDNPIDIAFLAIDESTINWINIARSLNKQCNIILITNAMCNAIDTNILHPSGFVKKPLDKNALIFELKNLRYPECLINKLKVTCYGNFEIFYNGLPLSFKRTKTKELVAYLVYKNGKCVTLDELCVALFPNDLKDEGHKVTVRVLVHDFRKKLEELGFDDVLIHSRNAYSINMNKIEIDTPPPQNIRGCKYMAQYVNWPFDE